MEQQFFLSQKLLELRDAARFLAGENYQHEISKWIGCLTQVAGNLRVSPIQAIPLACNANPMSELDVMWLCAAAVEMAEIKAAPEKL